MAMADDLTDALQLALLLEFLEAEFYQRGLAAAGLIPATDRTIFATILAHENAHVSALQALIRGKGVTPRAKPLFDFTAKGALPGFAFLPSQYDTFRMLAHALEDLGVRAYKGQAARLQGDRAVLTAAMSIHSVEARHAAEVRRLRGRKGWITSNSRDDLPFVFQPVYDGEENTTLGTVSLTGLPAVVGGVASITEAFDEPLTTAQVTAVVALFLP